MQGKGAIMISKEQVSHLIKTASAGGDKGRKAKDSLRQIAGQRIKENQAHNNRLVFMARVAIEKL